MTMDRRKLLAELLTVAASLLSAFSVRPAHAAPPWANRQRRPTGMFVRRGVVVVAPPRRLRWVCWWRARPARLRLALGLTRQARRLSASPRRRSSSMPANLRLAPARRVRKGRPAIHVMFEQIDVTVALRRRDGEHHVECELEKRHDGIRRDPATRPGPRGAAIQSASATGRADRRR